MKERQNGRKSEEDVCSYWMALRKREDPETETGRTRSHCGEPALEETLDMLQDRLHNQ
jgi:hypothetical protein